MWFPSKYSRLVSAALLVIGAIPLIIMMAVVTANSLGRAIFRAPITGTIEIAGLAGVIVVAAAVGFTARERANVAVDVLLSQLKPGAKRILDVVTLFLQFCGSLFSPLRNNPRCPQVLQDGGSDYDDELPHAPLQVRVGGRYLCPRLFSSRTFSYCDQKER